MDWEVCLVLTALLYTLLKYKAVIPHRSSHNRHTPSSKSTCPHRNRDAQRARFAFCVTPVWIRSRCTDFNSEASTWTRGNCGPNTQPLCSARSHRSPPSPSCVPQPQDNAPAPSHQTRSWDGAHLPWTAAVRGDTWPKQWCTAYFEAVQWQGGAPGTDLEFSASLVGAIDTDVSCHCKNLMFSSAFPIFLALLRLTLEPDPFQTGCLYTLTVLLIRMFQLTWVGHLAPSSEKKNESL